MHLTGKFSVLSAIASKIWCNINNNNVKSTNCNNNNVNNNDDDSTHNNGKYNDDGVTIVDTIFVVNCANVFHN